MKHYDSFNQFTTHFERLVGIKYCIALQSIRPTPSSCKKPSERRIEHRDNRYSSETWFIFISVTLSKLLTSLLSEIANTYKPSKGDSHLGTSTALINNCMSISFSLDSTSITSSVSSQEWFSWNFLATTLENLLIFSFERVF